MRRIKVKHFLQDPAHCAVASCAVVANYYNKEIDYNYAKELAYKKISKNIKDEGLDSGQICLLLNYLGFNKVTLVSSDLDIFDYTWEKYGKRKLKEVLKNTKNKKKDDGDKELVGNVYKWYVKKGYNNVIKIDYDFGKYIKKHLNRKKPVILTFNWTMYMKFAKAGEDNKEDPINGDYEEHAVAVNGYDNNGIWVVDSHHKYYKYKRKKYRRGFYKMKWEHFFSCAHQGDVYLPDDYCEDL